MPHIINRCILLMLLAFMVTPQRAQMISAKIAYTKSTEFSLGIEYSYMKVPLLNQQKETTVQSIALTMRFYF